MSEENIKKTNEKIYASGMSVAILARKTGLAEKTIHAILKGRQAVTPNITRMINRVVGDLNK